MKFHLDVIQEMLPEYISLEVAESILFVGKALRVLRNPSMTFKSQFPGSQRSSSKVTNRADDSTGKYFSPPIGGYQGPELLPPAEADTIASMLRDLKVNSLSDDMLPSSALPRVFLVSVFIDEFLIDLSGAEISRLS